MRHLPRWKQIDTVRLYSGLLGMRNPCINECRTSSEIEDEHDRNPVTPVFFVTRGSPFFVTEPWYSMHSLVFLDRNRNEREKYPQNPPSHQAKNKITQSIHILPFFSFCCHPCPLCPRKYMQESISMTKDGYH